MSFWNNSKIKKYISLALAFFSLSSAAGCKNMENKESDILFDGDDELKSENDYKFDESLDIEGVTICEENSHSSFEQENSELKHAIIGITEKDRLIEVLKEKNWGQAEETAILEMYDTAERNYDMRELYNPKDKQLYLRNLVNTIKVIKDIRIDPNDNVLLQNGWNARADYYDNIIVLKFNNINDIRHEISHMEEGSFLLGSCGVDLGFVLEEGRASYIEADAMRNSQYIDNMSFNINKNDNNKILIHNCSGSYPAFEYVYKNMMRLGVDLEEIRRETIISNKLEARIVNELINQYGEELANEYMNSVNEYITFFNNHGLVELEVNQNGQNIIEVKENMDRIYEMCTSQKEFNEVKEISIDR